MALGCEAASAATSKGRFWWGVWMNDFCFFSALALSLWTVAGPLGCKSSRHMRFSKCLIWKKSHIGLLD